MDLKICLEPSVDLITPNQLVEIARLLENHELLAEYIGCDDEAAISSCFLDGEEVSNLRSDSGDQLDLEAFSRWILDILMQTEETFYSYLTLSKNHSTGQFTVKSEHQNLLVELEHDPSLYRDYIEDQRLIPLEPIDHDLVYRLHKAINHGDLKITSCLELCNLFRGLGISRLSADKKLGQKSIALSVEGDHKSPETTRLLTQIILNYLLNTEDHTNLRSVDRDLDLDSETRLAQATFVLEYFLNEPKSIMFWIDGFVETYARQPIHSRLRIDLSRCIQPNQSNCQTYAS